MISMRNLRRVFPAVALFCLEPACHGVATTSTPPLVQPFALNVVSSEASPLPIVNGKSASITITASSSYYIETWGIQAVYDSPYTLPGALCAVAIPGTTSATSIGYTIEAQASLTPPAYPCEQEITFEAFPQPAPSMTPNPSATPRWTSPLWISIQPSPTPSPTP